MLYKKFTRQTELTSIRRDCFVPRNDVVVISCFLLFAFTFLLSSCSMNPNLQGKGQPYLQGEWQQDSSALQQQLVTASRYHIKFDCDSFYLRIQSQTRVNYGAADTCTKGGRYEEYLKGTYLQRNDTLFLKGQFCNANFTLKLVAGCFRNGTYDEFFKVGKKADSLITLSGTGNPIPINLHLIKRTSCTQKPL